MRQQRFLHLDSWARQLERAFVKPRSAMARPHTGNTAEPLYQPSGVGYRRTGNGRCIPTDPEAALRDECAARVLAGSG